MTELPALTVVGIGADGWPGLTSAAHEALDTAEVVFGSARQLDLLPAELGAERIAWPTPLVPALASLLSTDPGRRRVVLASGDPSFHGIATTIARLLPGLPLTILPQPSSLSLACARLGWAQQDVEVVSLVGRRIELLHPALQPGRRVLVLASTTEPAELAALVRARGFGPSRIIVLSDLNAKDEQRAEATADAWPATGWPAGAEPRALSVVAIECLTGPEADRLSRTPGLPDGAYENDGQLTKRHVRAITLASLAPAPGELLWDVGGGAGSIGIEWMRQHPDCRAISVERDSGRVARIRRNAAALGVPGLDVITGSAPEVLAGHTRHGGELTRIQITQAAPIGRFTGWRPAMPVTQWTTRKD